MATRATTVGDRAAADDLLAAAAGRLLEQRESLIRDLVAQTRAEIAALDDDAATGSMLEASISENIVVALNVIARGISPEDLEAPTSALLFARALAQRDVPLSALVRAYRIGHTAVLDAAFAAMEDAPAADRAGAVIRLVRLSGQYIDRIVEQVGRTYEIERDRWVAGISGVRQQWVNDLLTGRAVDLAKASAALDYPVDGPHVALSFWAGPGTPTSEAGATFARVLEMLREATRAGASLLVPEGDRECLAWLAVPESRALAGREACRAFLADHDVAVGRSWPGRGLTGFRRGASQVRTARDLHRSRFPAPGPGERWVEYTDVAVAGLLGANRRALAESVAHTLGELAAPTARNRMLRETLAAFLRHHRSYQATAEAMNLHRNSVQYRVQQAQELLPAAATRADDLPLRCALEAAEWFPA